MSKSSVSSQAASERKAAEAQLRQFVLKFAPDHLRLVDAARRCLRKRLPTAHELVYEYRDFVITSFSPTVRGYEGVLAVRASADGVRLCFNRGKELPDLAKLLKGSGSLVRWVSLETAAALNRPPISSLIDEAIARNPVPFEKTGRGSVIIQSTTTDKKRPKRRTA